MFVLNNINSDIINSISNLESINNYGILDVYGDVNVNHLNSSDSGITTIGGNLIVNKFLDNRGGVIDVKGNADLKGLLNYGVINASELYIYAVYNPNDHYFYNAFANFGTINSNNLYAESSYLNNTGIINAKENMEIKSLTIFNSGELNTKNLKLTFILFILYFNVITSF